MNFWPKIPIGWKRVYIGETMMDGDLCCAENAPEVSPDRIAFEARLIWETRGKPIGFDKEIWLEAEAKLLNNFWRPIDPNLVGQRYWSGKFTIRKDSSLGNKESFNNTDNNAPVFVFKSTKDKVAEYLGKLTKKI